MSRFYVGQRIKKVSGMNVGVEAVVYDHSPSPWWRDEGCDIRVILEAGTICEDATGREVPVPDGHPVNTFSCQWTPICRPHEACDTKFKASLDELLARQEQPA